MRQTLRYGFPVLIVLLLLALFRPTVRILKGMAGNEEAVPSVSNGHADDVSRMNSSSIDSLVPVESDPDRAIAQLRELLAYAGENQLSISIAGARHSMGGHTIAPYGIQVSMLPFNAMSLDTITNILTVGSGALWSEIIPYLNAHGRAVSIMQSDNAFSVGGSISVNCHGWQHNKPPIASTVGSFRLLKADGTIIECSRTNEPELFALALGGYGLFGIILDVSLQTVPNEVYTYHRLALASENYIRHYEERIDADPAVRMVYGRLNVNEKNFLGKAMLHYFVFDSLARPGHPLAGPELVALKRSVFQGSRKDDYGKKLRWNSEQAFSKVSIGGYFSRNEIMNEDPFYLNTSATHADILHEYFIPRKNFDAFIEQLQQIIPRHDQNLLNVTIRNVLQDEDSFLRYAEEEVFGFVMFFEQAFDPAAEKDMQEMTVALIDAAHTLGGTYYLPYRLHATQEQFDRVYTMSGEFFSRKREHDPQGIFQNMFYMEYGGVPLP